MNFTVVVSNLYHSDMFMLFFNNYKIKYRSIMTLFIFFNNLTTFLFS